MKKGYPPQTDKRERLESHGQAHGATKGNTREKQEIGRHIVNFRRQGKRDTRRKREVRKSWSSPEGNENENETPISSGELGKTSPSPEGHKKEILATSRHLGEKL